MRPVLAVVMTMCLVGAVGAQEIKSKDAVDVTAADIQKLIDVGANNPIKSVDAGKHAVFVWFETRKPGGPGEGGVIHSQLTEVYHIVQGTALLRTGGTLTDTKRLIVPGNLPGTEFARFPNPGFTGKIVGGVSRKVGPGDVIVVPPDTAHLWEKVDPPMIAYYIIRVDPDHLLHSGYTNPVLTKR
jgi:mannose-6-phosphate isomerase-like protein (cupin superfamily)